MTIATTKKLTFEEYLNLCETSQERYELVRGELHLMTPPAWLHFLIADRLVTAFKQEIAQNDRPWIVVQGAGLQTMNDTSRLPDIAIVPFDAISDCLDRTAILTVAAILVVEIASDSTALQDYREKVTEYQNRGIQEYWIADPDPFGAAKYIGSPKRPTVSVYSLVNGGYQVNRFRDRERIISPTFPGLQLTAAQILWKDDEVKRNC
ncbi:Uma2 family endonuclease [Pseudanabaena sp. PCC 6802]|uniref:Uma2 family endonuclease n=1 Tax=Pseudanabaena sp. PCC 6802 TaxID=118173 RepID=UPI00034B8099|nr:Uma2 family endonuclease [Pseudanabaena sp. PCC 6802]